MSVAKARSFRIAESETNEVMIGAKAGDAKDVELMEAIPQEKQLTVTFSSISGWVPLMSKADPPLQKVKNLFTSKQEVHEAAKIQRKQIMYKLAGACYPGEVLALMGPSGSSKTSLLSVIGGRTPKSVHLEGDVLYNNTRLTKATKRSVGYVLQDDLLYESLTVWETLYFAAMLRLPREMSTEQKKQRVAKVIAALGLNRCKDTIIGGFFRRGISGGERKRVSVGHEMIINPSVLLLDEPTSGLDSTTAMHLVATLRQLAQGGRAVLTTIHQPSSRLYQMLDKLLLLSEGHSIYYGDAQLATEWFHKLGYTIPYLINAADFILDLASGDVSTKKISGADSRLHLINCAERFLTEHPGGYQADSKVSENVLGSELWNAAQSRRNLTGGTQPTMNPLDEAAKESSAHTGPVSSARDDYALASPLQVVVDTQEGNPQKGAKQYRWGAPYREQLRILFTRTIKTRRFEALSTRDFLQFLIVGVLAGLFWLQAGQTSTVAGVNNLRGLLFFELMFMSMRAMLGALFTFPSEFKMMLKERASGMYRLSAFYFARTASDLPIDCTIPTCFIIIVYFMGGLRYNAGSFFANWAAVLLSLLTAQSIGLLVGSVITHPKTGQTIATITALTMILVAGFFVQSIPDWIGWLKYLSFIYYGYNTLLKIQFKGMTIYDCGTTYNPKHPETNSACTVVTNLKDSLRLQEDPNQWVWEPLALIAYLLFFRALVYIALRKRTKASVR
ncbi:hypothetical protein WJX79_011032 [Trebouxia sp. C0005]|nr:MAG: ABC transporter G family member 22 [Trebouxia sp. A1-2]